MKYASFCLIWCISIWDFRIWLISGISELKKCWFNEELGVLYFWSFSWIRLIEMNILFEIWKLCTQIHRLSYGFLEFGWFLEFLSWKRLIWWRAGEMGFFKRAVVIQWIWVLVTLLEILVMFDWLGVYLFADRTSGQLAGLNSENGGVSDAKNLRVKVLFYCQSVFQGCCFSHIFRFRWSQLVVYIYILYYYLFFHETLQSVWVNERRVMYWESLF